MILKSELPLKEWFKLNFGHLVQRDKAKAGFIIRNDICALVGASSILVILVAVPDAEIQGLWKVICWAIERVFGQHVVVEEMIKTYLFCLRDMMIILIISPTSHANFSV